MRQVHKDGSLSLFGPNINFVRDHPLHAQFVRRSCDFRLDKNDTPSRASNPSLGGESTSRAAASDALIQGREYCAHAGGMRTGYAVQQRSQKAIRQLLAHRFDIDTALPPDSSDRLPSFFRSTTIQFLLHLFTSPPFSSQRQSAHRRTPRANPRADIGSQGGRRLDELTADIDKVLALFIDSYNFK